MGGVTPPKYRSYSSPSWTQRVWNRSFMSLIKIPPYSTCSTYVIPQIFERFLFFRVDSRFFIYIDWTRWLLKHVNGSFSFFSTALDTMTWVMVLITSVRSDSFWVYIPLLQCGVKYFPFKRNLFPHVECFKGYRMSFVDGINFGLRKDSQCKSWTKEVHLLWH